MNQIDKYTYLEPILTKDDPHALDYKLLGVDSLIKLQNAAQETADSWGYPVYLVGSAIYKIIPRDIDVSVIIPVDEYEKLFGPIPKTQDEFPQYLCDVFNKSFKYIEPLIFTLCGTHHMDVKVCPNVWWVEKEKILLAEPFK